MSKKVLLIYPPVIKQLPTINISAFDKSIGSYPPLGLLYVATYMKAHTDYEVEVLDCFVDSLSFDEIRNEIKERAPDLIGIEAMTHFLVDVIEIAEISKQLFPDVKVVVGGPHASIYPVTTVKNRYVDYTVKGEGEVCFTQLAEAIFENSTEEEIFKIPGVATKLHVSKELKNDSVTTLAISDLNTIPYPDRTLVDHSKYSSIFADKGTFTTLMTSRGCPFKCIYCDRLGIEFRPVTSENFLKEVKEAVDMGLSNFFIHDDTFTVNKQRVRDICNALISEKVKIKWEARSRVDCVDYELLKLMKQAGMSRMSFGVESGNEKVLATLKKGIRLSRVEEVFKWCKELRITAFADFMIGSPGEGIKEIDDSIRFIRKIKPDYVQFSITCPYPATELYQQALDRKIIKSDVWLEFAENPDSNFVPPISSDHFNREELEAITAKAYRKVYFSLPFIIKEIRKISSFAMLLMRFKSALSLARG
jgi:radical SAM superfamily enzyme YgiQ (UPF0313 family)